MTPVEKHLKKLHQIRLPNAERLRMRSELLAYAELHSVATPARALRPFHIFTTRLYAGLAAVLICVVSVGGTAFASTDALPGDPLYTVKVGIAEPLQSALVPSDRGKATWHAILAERRLEEAALLASENKLSPDTQTKLAANLAANIEASVESADRLERAGDATGSLAVRSDLEARLTAHQHILDVIADHYAVATDAEATHTALTSLLAVVTEREAEVSTSRIALEDSLAPGPVAKESATVPLATATEAPKAPVAPALGPTASMSIEDHIQYTEAARTSEVDQIIAEHSALLAKFLPDPATTTASSTATTSAPTGIDSVEEVSTSTPATR